MNNIVKDLIRKSYLRARTKKLKHIGENCWIARGAEILGPEYISIGSSFTSGKGLMLQAWDHYNGKDFEGTPELTISDDVSFMKNCQVSCAKKIVIGKGTLFGDNVFVTDNFHGTGTKEELGLPPIKRNLYIKGEVIIGENVWVGRNACIMPGVEIGDGAIIGANSVVTRDVPANTVAAGVPARIIRTN